MLGSEGKRRRREVSERQVQREQSECEELDVTLCNDQGGVLKTPERGS
jgi:transposase